MRPVNLIPVEQRRGEHAQLRTGPLMYIVLGALALVLIGVTMLVLTDNRIADSKAEVATLTREDAAAEAQAQRLAAYSQFRTLAEQRIATVRSLADSRFDWERVMRELSLILPHDVWLISLEASASSESEGGSSSGSSGSSLKSSIPGPSLTISGCAAGPDAVAGFVTALKDIDGVTRVGVESAELADEEAGAGSVSGSSSGGGSSDCRTRSFIAQFSLVIAFDAAPAPSLATEESAPISPTEKSEAAASETSGESTEGSEGG